MSSLSKLSPKRVLGALRRRMQFVGVAKNYQPGASALREQTVLFESFQGRIVGDSPLAIYQELQRRKPEWDFVWAVADGQVAPAGSRSVLWGSVEWLKLLASAKYLVNNANFPYFFRKAPGQIYLQTWHGTPLKRLGRDVPGAVLGVGYQATMEREAKAWDYLVSPNQFFSEVFPPAFAFNGELLLTGYPRNDVLSSASKSVRNEIRSSLGLSKDEVAVLYAPTWRDYEQTRSGDWAAFNYLPADFKLPNKMRLLFRGHHNTLASHDRDLAGSAIDVTQVADIAQLYIAADVLVTDFSSSMFDFSVTGKPMVFFAPDLERYRAERGFYLDYEEEIPGPLVTTPSQLIDSLLNIDKVSKDFAKKYRNWQQRFNSLEDGNAAKRVVSAVWGN